MDLMQKTRHSLLTAALYKFVEEHGISHQDVILQGLMPSCTPLPESGGVFCKFTFCNRLAPSVRATYAVVSYLDGEGFLARDDD